MKKIVRFSGRDSIYELKESEEDDPNTDWMHESLRRRHNESIINPNSDLERMYSLVASWRKHETNVVFGNVGRQPHLLNYYLDLCFGHEDDVRVECQWKLPISYQTEMGGTDFLILVEPHFGFSVKRPAFTQHFVVLTSHMNLFLSEENTKVCLFHLPCRKNYVDPQLEHYKVFKPPIFHVDLPIPDVVLLDVTAAKSAVEAYLRLLTGREMIKERPFKVLMNDDQRKVMEAHINTSRQHVERYWRQPWMENVYWSGFF